VKPYAFEDVVRDLHAVAPYDWKELLQRRLTATTEHAPLEGVVLAGWRLTYGEKPTDFFKNMQSQSKSLDYTSSLGLLLSPEGSVTEIIPGTAADQAGLAPGMKVVAVNTRRWSSEVLAAAVAATKKPGSRLEFLVENGDVFQTYALAYQGGEKYPRLERDANRADLLSEILKPRAAHAQGSGS